MSFDFIDEIIFKAPRLSTDPSCSWLPLYRNVNRQHADEHARNFYEREGAENCSNSNGQTEIEDLSIYYLIPESMN